MPYLLVCKNHDEPFYEVAFSNLSTSTHTKTSAEQIIWEHDKKFQHKKSEWRIVPIKREYYDKLISFWKRKKVKREILRLLKGDELLS